MMSYTGIDVKGHDMSKMSAVHLDVIWVKFEGQSS